MSASLAFQLWLGAHSDDEADAGERSNTDENRPQHENAPPAADVALIERIQAGDDTAFHTLYTTYYTLLAEYAAGLVHDAGLAHDVVQEVFLVLWRTRATWAPVHIAAYLYHAVRNRALNTMSAQRRHAHLHAEHGEEVPAIGERPLAPDDAMHLSAFHAALVRAIDALPPTRREIAVLRWRHGKSLQEIATIVGSSVKAVSMQLTRTRGTLQVVVDTYLRDT